MSKKAKKQSIEPALDDVDIEHEVKMSEMTSDEIFDQFYADTPQKHKTHLDHLAHHWPINAWYANKLDSYALLEKFGLEGLNAKNGRKIKHIDNAKQFVKIWVDKINAIRFAGISGKNPINHVLYLIAILREFEAYGIRKQLKIQKEERSKIASHALKSRKNEQTYAIINKIKPEWEEWQIKRHLYKSKAKFAAAMSEKHSRDRNGNEFEEPLSTENIIKKHEKMGE